MQNLQSKPTWKVLLKIAIPIIIANILQTVYQLIDTFWVGRLGKEAIASVSLSFPITFFLISVSMWFAMAGSIMVAQYYWKWDQEKIRIITGQILSFVVVLSVLMGFLWFFVSEYILRFFYGWYSNSGTVSHLYETNFSFTSCYVCFYGNTVKFEVNSWGQDSYANYFDYSNFKFFSGSYFDVLTKIYTRIGY